MKLDTAFIPGQVPCNGCTACCHRDAVRLTAQDDPKQYQTEPHAYHPDALMLAHKSNGECLYLKPTGCGIHARRPYMCRTMDCRLIAQQYTFVQAQALDQQDKVRLKVWRAGKERLLVQNRAVSDTPKRSVRK